MATWKRSKLLKLNFIFYIKDTIPMFLGIKNELKILQKQN